jgi:alanine racemase
MEVSSVPKSTRIWAEIDPLALQHNLSVIRTQIGPDAQIIAVVKADAYGHGTHCVVPCIKDQVDILAVANIAEAEMVQSLGTGLPVFILSPCLPEERAAAIALGSIVTVSSIREAAAFASLAAPGCPISCVLKIDSGMGRIGVPLIHAEETLRGILEIDGLVLHSIATHLPSADEDEAFTSDQLTRFSEWLDSVRKWLPDVRVQVLNSAGASKCASHAYDFVRIGLALYGISPFADQQSSFRPALAWKSRVVQVRAVAAGHGISYGRSHITKSATRVAIVAAGYADGYPRQASGQGAEVIIGGTRCPLLGRVTMDQIMVDVTAVGEVVPGDEVVLVGSQGQSIILASELATWSNTIAWDIFTGIGTRTVRVIHPRSAH